MQQVQQTLNMEQALEELDKRAPDAPLLALGQTVFWDEPLKAGIALRLANRRRFVAGVHDTDYFAKASSRSAQGGFKALPHNDTTTKNLWSAAAEFSALFGSETVVTREILQEHGLRVARMMHEREGFLDSATEAWGWKGVVSLAPNAPITAEVKAVEVLPAIRETLDWALQTTIESLCADTKASVREVANRILALLDGAAASAGPDATLSEVYQRLLPAMYELTAGEPVDLDLTRTSELLRFNLNTCKLPRFELAALFFDYRTRDAACAMYDEAIAGSGLYGLSRFRIGAVPFDIVIPGIGRGTLRLGTRAAVIMTPEPQFISFTAPLTDICEFATALERKFGPDCVLVGKAVTLIGMLAREFVFAFHEGASSYVKHSRVLHQKLAAAGHPLKLHPILRIRYDAWSALDATCGWFKLPSPFRRPFGAEEICTPSFAHRWKGVVQDQETRLASLKALVRPIDLIVALDAALGGAWNSLAKEYAALHSQLEGLMQEIEAMREARRQLYGHLKRLKAERIEAEIAKGNHFRAKIFEKSPSEEDLTRRKELSIAVEAAIERISTCRRELADSVAEQRALASGVEVQRFQRRRREIELEAELERLRLIRDAVITARGLDKASHRPSGWWLPMVSPGGEWFRATVERAECYLESLI